MYDVDFLLKINNQLECEKVESNNKIILSTNILTNNNIQTNINITTNENIHTTEKNIYNSPKKISNVKITSVNETSNKLLNSSNKQNSQKINSKYANEPNSAVRKINWIERQTVFQQKKKKNESELEVFKFSEIDFAKDKNENKEDLLSKLIKAGK